MVQDDALYDDADEKDDDYDYFDCNGDDDGFKPPCHQPRGLFQDEYDDFDDEYDGEVGHYDDVSDDNELAIRPWNDECDDDGKSRNFSQS